MKAALLIALALCWCDARPAFAQAPDPHDAQPERPTVATHAGTVARGWVEMEMGAESDRYGDTSRGAVVPVVTKIGLASHVQLSIVGAGVRPPRGGAAGSSDVLLGAGDLAVGVKWRLADNLPVLGRFAVFPTVKFPTGAAASGTGTGTTDAGLLLISSHDVGPVALDLHVGFTRRSGDGQTAPKNATVWTVSFGGPARGPLGWAAEVFGYPTTSGPAGQGATTAALFGPTFALRGWLVLDAGVIVPLSGSPPRAVYAGATWNVGRAWK
jgi:hypothetical protein